MPKFVFLWTDIVLFAMLLLLAIYAWRVRGNKNLRANWAKVARDPAALGASIVLLVFALVTVLDSVHFRRALSSAPGAAANAVQSYSPVTESLLDVLLAQQIATRETGYSRPLDWLGFSKVPLIRDGEAVRDFPRLTYGGAHLTDPERQWAGDVGRRVALGALAGLAVTAVAFLLTGLALRREHGGWGAALRDIAADRSTVPLRAALLTFGGICLLAGPIAVLADGYHVFGTDRTGNDVLVQTLKSVRTAFVIGALATLATLPLAVVLGILAGYFRGWVDEVIQYLYTVLSSIPNILLIAALVLMVQVFLDKHPELFETGLERADLKLFLLCAVLGLTGWAGLCRLLRAETLKLRELDFVQAAQAFGVGNVRVMSRHVFPNVAHLMLIVTVLDFSSLILYEAVLSYVGVGVDPSMNSFGGMINFARNEMSRDPVVWWSFAAAFSFMVTLVLAANLFADGVRDAFDPRSRTFKPRVLKKAAA